MYIEFGRRTVNAPPLVGLMELADRHNGTVSMTAEGVGIHLPFNEELNLLRDRKEATVLKFPPARIRKPQKRWVPEGAYGMGVRIVRQDSTHLRDPTDPQFIPAEAIG